MEFNLKQDQLNGYRTLLDTVIAHEETMEAIVPDACPDIAQVVDTWGQVLLKSREAQEGRVEATGTVQCVVLYRPDGESGLRRMEVGVPFTCAASAEGVTPACRVVASPQVSFAEARLLNPRKILLRIGLSTGMRAFAATEELLCTGVEEGEEVEQLVEEYGAYLTVCVQEKPFSFEDELEIPGGRPDGLELLRSGACFRCSESRIIGNKLIFKGEAALKLLYRAEEGETATAEFTLPFSQIMEVSEAGEDADCAVEVLPTDFSCALLGDGRTVSVSMELLAQAVVREERRIKLLSDLYCTSRGVKPEMRSYTFSQLVESNSRRQTVRGMIETETLVKTVIDAYVTLGPVTQSRDGEHGGVHAQATVTVLYLGEDLTVGTAVETMDVPCTLELPEGCVCTCACRSAAETFASPASGGLEVRFDVEFSWLALTSLRTGGVVGVEAGEAWDSGEEALPSIVLRSVGDERLWEIAKTYRTTRAEILRANELESGDSLEGRLLLIPRKR